MNKKNFEKAINDSLENMDIYLNWIPLEKAEKELFKKAWIYYRPLGITHCGFGLHPLVAAYLLVHHNFKDAINEFEKSDKSINLFISESAVNHRKKIDDSMGTLLKETASAFHSGASMITKAPAFYDEQGKLSEKEMDVIGSIVPFMDINEWYEMTR